MLHPTRHCIADARIRRRTYKCSHVTNLHAFGSGSSWRQHDRADASTT